MRYNGASTSMFQYLKQQCKGHDTISKLLYKLHKINKSNETPQEWRTNMLWSTHKIKTAKGMRQWNEDHQQQYIS